VERLDSSRSASETRARDVQFAAGPFKEKRMIRRFAWYPVVGAMSLVSWMGCGGSTESFSNEGLDGGGGDQTERGTGGSAGTSTGAGGSSGSATSTDGGAPTFDPGAIGGLVGGGMDGGQTMVTADGGVAVGPGGGVIRPEVVDGCNELCVKEVAANCPNQGTLANCIVGCRLILNNMSCMAPANALFACEKNSPAACDNQGKATLTGCGVEQLNAAACFLQNANDPTLSTSCKSYCAGVAAAKCPNDDAAGCATGCPVIGNFIPGCNMFWEKYVTCAGAATFTCGNDGKAGAPACAAPALAFFLCTTAGVLNTGDAGR
jgi:hypothetical protein